MKKHELSDMLRSCAHSQEDAVQYNTIHAAADALDTLTRRVAELEQEREQWEVNWNNAADFDLCRDLADGKPIAPAPGSVPDKLMSRVAELEKELIRAVSHCEEACLAERRALERVEELEADLTVARACKPDEYTLIVASERAASERASIAERRVKELEAIVAKLPKTADGVPIVPGMFLYELKDGKAVAMESMPCCGFDIAANGRVHLFFQVRKDMERDLIGIYSTEAAALAAKGGA